MLFISPSLYNYLYVFSVTSGQSAEFLSQTSEDGSGTNCFAETFFDAGFRVDFHMDELDKVKLSYANGEFEPILKQLEVFIESNKEKILRFKKQEEHNWKRSLDLATATKLFILHVRSIDFNAEMQDQIHEINKTLGCCGDDQNQNSKCIAWVQKFAPIWRAYRVLAIIYVFDQNREMLLSYLQNDMAMASNC